MQIMTVDPNKKRLLKAYYYLTKPGIIYGNLLAATGGFLLASKGHIDPLLLLATLAGTALVIACGCVLNNYIDRNIDKKMARTQKRALATGLISGRDAIIYASILGVLGFSLLIAFTNILTVAAGAIGLSFYVVVYGAAKRHSTLGTIVGSIPGATPPVAGYVAVTGNFDAGAALLFLIMAIWQMPHFYAISVFRLKDYTAAGLPVMAVKKGVRATKIYIMLYIAAYLAVVPLLTILGYTGYTYLTVMGLVGLAWFWKGIENFAVGDGAAWARKMFGFSLIVLLVFSFMISVDAWLP